MVDETKLNAFIGKMLGDLGGAFSVPMVRMGDKLGFYTALKEQPMTPKELAAKTKVAERYAREWLSHQAASGYLEYDAASGQFALPPEQAMVFADVDSPVYLQGAFDLAVAMIENQRKSRRPFAQARASAGATRRRASSAPLVASSAPATITILSGLGCRRWTASPPSSKAAPKWRTLVVVMVFRPSSWRRRSRNRFSSATTFIPNSVAQARAHAERHGATANTKFEVATAADFPGKDLDLVTFFDCLHDMGDPVGAARHVRKTLNSDGSWMIVEPAAGDQLEDNLNPVSRMFYAASTMICVPTSLNQPVGAAFGAQAGFGKLSSAITQGGFGKVRKATETPFNMILEARP